MWREKLVVICFLISLASSLPVAGELKLIEWFKDNSETLVMLKHLTKMTNASFPWQELKSTPEVTRDLLHFKNIFQSPVLNETAATNSTSETVPICSFQCGTASENLIDSSVTSQPSDFHANLTKRIEELEAKYDQLIRGQSPVPTNHSVGNDSAHGAPLASLKKWVDRYEEDLSWIRSQFIPLNYLFDKLRKIEEDALQVRDMISTRLNESFSLPSNFTGDVLAKIEKLDHEDREKWEALSSKQTELESKVEAAYQLINQTNQRVEELQTKGLHVATRPASPSNGTEEPEYCPDRLDELVPCAEVNDWCYCFSKQQRNWSDAMEYCKKNDMDLLSLETEKEATAIQNYIKRSGLPQDFYWTSGSDDAVEGTWTWASANKDLTYANWRINQPDGGRKENCLYLHSRDDFRWGDWLCNLPQHFICEW